MPRLAATRKNDNRGLYVHNPLAVAKTVSASKTGGIRTFVSTHQSDSQPDDAPSESGPDNDTESNDPGQDNDPEQPTPIDKATISGISVKTPTKRYLNS
ncbi:hypothetical protein DXG01_013556, partial [Tephrocybe rancida]